MTAKNLKRSQAKHVGRVTNAGLSGALSTKKTVESLPSKLSFQARNNFYIIEEDPIDFLDSGLSAVVEQALKDSRLFIPDNVSNFAQKFPCTGKVVSKGDETKYEKIRIGMRVLFSRLGVQRFLVKGKSYVSCLEGELHATID